MLTSDQILLALGKDLHARHPERYKAERLRALKADRRRQTKLALARDNRQTLPELVASVIALGDMIFDKEN